MDFIFGSKDKKDYKPEPLAPELQMPHSLRTYIVESCFDSCIETFNHKKIMPEESNCIKSCTENLKNIPYSY